MAAVTRSETGAALEQPFLDQEGGDTAKGGTKEVTPPCPQTRRMGDAPSLVSRHMTHCADDTTGPHVCPASLQFDVDIHETTLRVNVRWVTPLGEETASTS